MADYQVTAWQFSDFGGTFTNYTNPWGPDADTITTGTYAEGTSTTLSSTATSQTFMITDDDTSFEDLFVETGAPSTLTNTITVNGVDYPAGTIIEAEYMLETDDVPSVLLVVGRLTEPGGSPSFSENLLVFAIGEVTPGQTFNLVTASDGATELYGTICFAKGSLIDTPHGQIPVDMLMAGDEVLTRDAGIATVSWAGHREFSGFELSQNPHLRPIRIRKNALGPNRPDRDLVVSPQHRVLIDDWRACYHFGEDEVLVPAKALLNDADITIDRLQTGVTYYHILLENHELLSANGQWAESLFPGKAAFETLTAQQKFEIELIYPEFFTSYSDTYRPTLPMVPFGAAAALAA